MSSRAVLPSVVLVVAAASDILLLLPSPFPLLLLSLLSIGSQLPK